jgi:hypothetical protein
MKAQQSC